MVPICIPVLSPSWSIWIIVWPQKTMIITFLASWPSMCEQIVKFAYFYNLSHFKCPHSHDKLSWHFHGSTGITKYLLHPWDSLSIDVILNNKMSMCHNQVGLVIFLCHHNFSFNLVETHFWLHHVKSSYKL